MHGRVLFQRRLDLRRFDPVAPHLGLSVQPTFEEQDPVAPPAHAVARAEEPAARIGAERVGHETLRGQPRPAEVAPRQRRAAHVQLPGDAGRHRPHPRVQHVQPCVRDRPAQGERTGFIRIGFPVRHLDRAFGGAVEVDQWYGGDFPLHRLAQPGRERLAAAEQATQATPGTEARAAP